MYIKSKIIGNAFKRLRESESSLGKKGLERTTSLFRFLAFDMLCKERGENILLFDPDSALGRDNREKLIGYYSEIALIEIKEDRKEWLIDNLGSCNTDGKRSCRGKVANDFLTTHLKKASEAGKILPYPRRPKTLMTLGHKISGKAWGIEKHFDWSANINLFIEDRRSLHPWTDLLIVLMRKYDLPPSTSFYDSIFYYLEKKFTLDLTRFFKQRIQFDKKGYIETEIGTEWSTKKYINELCKEVYCRPRNPDKDEIIKDLTEENRLLKKRIRELEEFATEKGED